MIKGMARTPPRILLIGAAFLIFNAAGRTQFSPAPLPAGQDSLLHSYIEESLANHPNLNSMRAMIEAQEARIRMAGGWMNPNLMLGIMNLPTSLDFHEEGMTATEIGFMLRLPFPGKLSAAKQAQEASEASTRSEYEQMQLTMISMVRMAYYDLAGNLVVSAALDEARNRAADMVTTAGIMTSSGMGSRADILRAQLEFDQWGKRVIESDRRIADARSRLALALGRTSTEGLHDPIPLSAPEALPSLEDLIGPSLEQIPYRQAQEEKVKVAEFELKRVRLDWWPDVDLTVKYGFRGYLNPGPDAIAMGLTDPMEQRDMLSLQAAFPLPLFGRNNQGAQVAENEARLRQTQADYQAGGINLRDEVRQVYNRLQAAQATYRLISDTLLPRAEEIFQASLPEYQTGLIPFMSLNVALMQVVMQKMDQAMALSEAHMARAELERLVGRR
jgi:cobalt-zinc-cadmium efflux system outer membrane protein